MGSSLDVPVSCTESGRWSYQSAQFSSSGSMAYAQLRKAKAASVSKSLRLRECHASNQGEVWDEIEMLHHMAESGDKSRTRAMQDAYRERRQDLDEFARPEAYGRLHRRRRWSVE